jgi:uncharacterized repeat protein (TIGR01451 family)
MEHKLRAFVRVSVIMRIAFELLPLTAGAALASGQATLQELAVRTVAEVETRSVQDGRVSVKLVPADRVVPGDEVIYTLEIRNTGATALKTPVVVNPIPAHMIYVAGSASGPGADVSYSVDGGRTFDRAENLYVVGADGTQQLAKPNDYTHIQWKLRNILKSNSVAFAHFRAVVK